MWDKLWLNIHLATLRPSKTPYGAINDGAIASKDGKIIWLGKKSDLPNVPSKLASQIIEMDGEWVTPGLIDCHTHLIFGGQRADEFARKLQGESYESILASGGGVLSTLQATRNTSFEELLKIASMRLHDAMRQGVTTIEIKSGYGLNLENELKILRIAKKLEKIFPITIQSTCLAAHVVPPEYRSQRAHYVQWIIDELLPVVQKENLASAIDVFCEKIAFSLEETAIIFRKAKILGFDLKIHAEQLSWLGGAALAAHYQALSADHLEYMREEDVMALAKGGTVAVLLPGAFYFLRETQIPPIDLLRQYHVPIALATDFNPGTSPINSLSTIMNLACVLWNFTPEEALRSVTVNAAKALGLEEECGSLEVGKNADLVFWKIETPAELAYYIHGRCCEKWVKKGMSIDFSYFS